MSKKISAIIGMLLTVVMLVSFSVGTFEAGAAVSASYDTYLADYLLTNDTAQSYINRDFKLPYRKYVEDRRNSLTYTAILEAWEILTFDAKLADKSGKCVAYYETVLYDTIYGGLDGNSELNDLTSKVSSVKASTMKTLMEYSENLIDYELEDIKKGTDLYDTLLKEFVTCDALKDAFETISDLKDQLDKCKDLYEAVEKVAKVEALVENQEQIKKIVTDIGNSTANPALKLACARMTVIMDDVIPDQIIAGVFASESTIGEAVDDGFKAVWDAILVDVAGAKLTIAVKTGQKSGKLAAGILFSTDKDVEHVYAMDALYDIEDITLNLVKKYQSQYKSNPTQANAKLYTEAFKQLIKTYIEGVDYSKTYAEITNEQGLINQLFKKFEGDDYKRFISMLDDMRFTYEDYLNYIDVCVYNNYLADVPNETVKKKVKVVKKTTETTDADITSYFNTYKEVDALYTNRVVKEEWILTEDYTTYGSLTIEADVDLNGHTLNVGGDVTHTNGNILIHNGSLIIDGDYYNAYERTDSDERTVYDYAEGILRMTWENDYMYVGGNFITKCEKTQALTEGTLEVAGNIEIYRSYNGDSLYGLFQATDNHKLFLSGTGEQKIYVEDSRDRFNIVEIKSSSSRNIILNGNVVFENSTTCDGVFNVKSENASVDFGVIKANKLNISGDISLIGATVFNINEVTVMGNLNLQGDLDIDGNKLVISGSLNHKKGSLLLKNGCIIIKSNYYNAYERTDSDGRTVYDYAEGILRMTWENDYMYVGGNFITKCEKTQALTEGTLEVAGNIEIYRSYNGDSLYGLFQATDNHKLFLSGTGEQKIYVESSSDKFNIVEIQNANKRTIKLTGEFHANNIIIDGAVTINSSNKNATISNVTLKEGSSLTLTGNLNGLTSVNKATFTSDTASSATSSSNVITAVKDGSANITISNNGTSSKITVNVEKPFELGDVNRDGEVNVADAVILQKWLLVVPNTRLPDWKLCDLCEDGRIDVFDLCLLKRKLINN